MPHKDPPLRNKINYCCFFACFDGNKTTDTAVFLQEKIKCLIYHMFSRKRSQITQLIIVVIEFSAAVSELSELLYFKFNFSHDYRRSPDDMGFTEVQISGRHIIELVVCLFVCLASHY